MSNSFYTREQKRVMRYQGLSKVHYHKNMYSRNHELGYAKPGSPYSEIHIAADVAEDVKRVTLLHEVGHIYFNHVNVNIKEELKEIKVLFEKNGMNFKNGIRRFGGPMSFLNICMDLEVNSKLLTLANVKTMYDNNFKILTQKSLKVETFDTFRDYYEPIILKLKEQEEKEKENRKNNQKNSQKSEGQSNDSFGDDVDEGEGSYYDYDDYDDEDDYDDSCDNGDSSEDGLVESNGDGDSESDGGEDSKDSKSASEDDEDSQENEKPASEDDVDFSDLLDKAMRDLSSAVDPMDSDLDDEMSEALRDENYERKDDETPETEKSVNDSVDSVEDEENVDEPTMSNQNDDSREVEVVENTDKEISRFLTGILHTSFGATLNYIKNYNRGTRRNNGGILYSSLDSRVMTKKTRLGVLIDVSGSMETESIIKACSSLRAVSKALDSKSIGVTWNIYKSQEFSLFDVPESVSVGGGTNMARGLEYLVNEKKCDSVVIYSDFCTDDFDDMLTLIKKKGTKVYSIDVAKDKMYNGKCVLPYGVTDEQWNEYVKLNKGFLRVV